MSVWTDKFSFSTGAVRKRDILYFILTNDGLAKEEKPHAQFAIWHAGKWLDAGTFKWASPSIAVARQPREQMIAVGEGGEVLMQGSGDVHEEKVLDGDVLPQSRGTLRAVRWIGSHAYAAGMDRQVYRREDLNRWSCIDATMRPPKGSGVVGFEAIDGRSETDLFAVGWQGAIWHYDGGRWSQENSSTTHILGNVCCGPDEQVFACGRRGTLLSRTAGGWQAVEHKTTEEDLYGLAWFNGALYVASLHHVYRLASDGGLERVLPDSEASVTSAYHLSAADGVLMSVGAKDVLLFDGKSWARID